jgi:hypothetical protein
MTAIYTWDVFSTLDGYGSYAEGADWGGYWGKQGPELLEHRAALFNAEQRMVFGATTFRETAQIMSSGIEPDEWAARTMRMPTTVISSTLQDTLGWPDATIVSGDAVDIVARLKQESDVPLRSQASLSLNSDGVTHGGTYCLIRGPPLHAASAAACASHMLMTTPSTKSCNAVARPGSSTATSPRQKLVLRTEPTRVSPRTSSSSLPQKDLRRKW